MNVKIEESSPQYDRNLEIELQALRREQTELGSSVILPPHMTRAEMQAVFAKRCEEQSEREAIQERIIEGLMACLFSLFSFLSF